MTRNDIDGDLQDLQPATPETVQVPVEDITELKKAIDGESWFRMAQVVQRFTERLPTPKPRLVAVDLDVYEVYSKTTGFEMAEQPDLFTTLDAMIDSYPGDVHIAHREGIKVAARAAFGVAS